MHLNIILTSMPRSPNWSLSLTFPHPNPAYASLLPISATCPAHLTLLHLFARTVYGELYRSVPLVLDHKRQALISLPAISKVKIKIVILNVRRGPQIPVAPQRNSYGVPFLDTQTDTCLMFHK